MQSSSTRPPLANSGPNIALADRVVIAWAAMSGNFWHADIIDRDGSDLTAWEAHLLARGVLREFTADYLAGPNPRILCRMHLAASMQATEKSIATRFAHKLN
ncbi:MAG: hypothetical protein SFU86_07415 [Pirellulaceae bacterium]|nr:hypothetical protein [Pirellulaceae bacterium]